MKRVTLTVAAILLAVPAVAWGKAGLEFDNQPELSQPGKKMTFVFMVIGEPRGPQSRNPAPVAGARPLISFRNARTGEVVRVRGGLTDVNGAGTGAVRLPDRGPWRASFSVAGKRIGAGEERQGGFEVGTGHEPLAVNPVDVMRPPSDVSRPRASGSGTPLWVVLLALAALLAAGGLGALRLGVPARLRALLGGGA